MILISRKLLFLYFLGFIICFPSCGQKDPPLEVTKDGSIAVVSDPTGAHIFLDGLDTGRTTPDTLVEIPIGAHTVSVILPGFESSPTSLSVEVLENETIRAEFLLIATGKEGTVAVFSQPSGATIYLNGSNTGRTTPDTLPEIPAGSHIITVDLQGHKSCPETLTIDVLEGETSRAEFYLLSTQHVVLGEDFTSTTCEPCFPSSLVLDSLTELYSESFVVIRYHVGWPPPGDDPFYLANAEENNARTFDYYDIPFVPYLYLDGSIDAGRDHSVWEAILADRVNRETQVDIMISNTLDGLQGNANATIISCADLSGRMLRVHFVITESGIEFEAPNGKNIFHQVMRKMLPDTAGERITLVPDTEVQLHRTYTLDPGWDHELLHLIVFVQDDDTREIFQSASIPVQ